MDDVQASLDSTTPWIGMYVAAASAVCTLAMAAVWYNQNPREAEIETIAQAFELMDYTTAEQDSLDSPMPWIGMYIAAASAVCTLAMAADAFNGLRSKKYWLPCKYFSLNSFSLTLLAVAMKLPVDLTSLEMTAIDIFARISSLVLMSTAMNNFMTSLGSTENNDNMHSARPMLNVLQSQRSAYTAIMLLFLAALCSVSLMVPGVGLKYNEMHKSVSNRRVEWGRFSSVELENIVKAYWVMAATSSPQFVHARSAISSISGLLCVFAALFFVSVWIEKLDFQYDAGLIKKLEIIGVAMGTIAPLLKWFVALWFKISETERKSFRDEVKVDKYWTWRLVEWRDRSLPSQLQNRVCKKLLRNANRKPVSVGAHVGFNQYVLLLEGEPQLPSKILNNICNKADKLIKVGEKKQPKDLIQILNRFSNFNGVGRFDSTQIPSLHTQEPPNCWSLPVLTLTAISIALHNIDDENANQLLVCISEGLPIVKLIEETLDRSGVR
ncbi:uncharacterized protein LOC125189666 [Salvia hispanica]|uniref:uncharacterized protein LOC125189666 n=1 Tax=Salvia hispanica TaxID=49212 RepID=UPI0020094E00|nr:uncharacterized protein LOC125189666 [Salvia hispanica]